MKQTPSDLKIQPQATMSSPSDKQISHVALVFLHHMSLQEVGTSVFISSILHKHSCSLRQLVHLLLKTLSSAVDVYVLNDLMV